MGFDLIQRQKYFCILEYNLVKNSEFGLVLFDNSER